ncbi:hypothetical protein V3851_26570, partial [Paenibacillus sp. M1]
RIQQSYNDFGNSNRTAPKGSEWGKKIGIQFQPSSFGGRSHGRALGLGGTWILSALAVAMGAAVFRFIQG